MDAIVAEAAGVARAAFILLRETGMRVGELTHLTWADIDFEHGFIIIREKTWMQAKPGRAEPISMQWSPKTGDRRAVPMSPDARAVLEALPHHGCWVVNMPPTKKYPQLDRQLVDRWLLLQIKKIVKRLGLKGHLHTFRHSFISLALTRGIAEAIVRQWVGHVDPQIIRQYTHVLDDVSREAMRRLIEAGRQRRNNGDQASGETVA